jgi:hypothetical protein
MVDFITDAFDLQKARADLSTPSPETLQAREKENSERKKHDMFLRGLSMLTGRNHRSNISYPDYGTSSKSQSASIDKQINIEFMQAVSKIYEERGRLTQDELMTVGRAFNAGPAQYKLLKEMMPFIGIDRKEIAEQEVAESEARGSVVYDKAATEHLRLIREASPETVQDRVAEAVSDINNSTLSPTRKNAIREKYLAAASQAHALGKSARGEERTERKEVREVNKELRAVNKADLELQKTAREATDNKTERLLIYNALKEMKEVNTSGTYIAEDGVITAMTPGMTMQRQQELLAKYGEKAFTAGVDIKKVQDGITSGIVKAPSTKHVIDTHATNPDEKHVYRSDSEIELANAGGDDRYIPVYDGDKLSVIFRGSAMAVLRRINMDNAEGIELLQFMNKVGPLNAAAQRPQHSELIFDIMEEMEEKKNAWMQLLEGNFKGGSPSELKVNKVSQ